MANPRIESEPTQAGRLFLALPFLFESLCERVPELEYRSELNKIAPRIQFKTPRPIISIDRSDCPNTKIHKIEMPFK